MRQRCARVARARARAHRRPLVEAAANRLLELVEESGAADLGTVPPLDVEQLANHLEVEMLFAADLAQELDLLPAQRYVLVEVGPWEDFAGDLLVDHGEAVFELVLLGDPDPPDLLELVSEISSISETSCGPGPRTFSWASRTRRSQSSRAACL